MGKPFDPNMGGNFDAYVMLFIVICIMSVVYVVAHVLIQYWS